MPLSLFARVRKRIEVSAFRSAISREGASDLVRAVKDGKLTYLSEAKLAGICATIGGLKGRGVKGTYLEAGCALGGSSILIGALRPASAPFHIYDVFGMIPPPTDDDPPDVIERYKVIVSGKSQGIAGDTYYGYIADLEEVVKSNLAQHLSAEQRREVRLEKGLLQDTMHISSPVAFAHIDVDWYDPVRCSLERIVPHLAVGGALILDDYFDWGGCRKAVDEYLAETSVPVSREERYGNLILTRTA
jgi:hypothetical protein